jgi:AcrR family transcriptional regulator
MLRVPGDVNATQGARRGYDSSRRRDGSQETRRRILEAARVLLIEHGYHATSVAEIARAAEVHIDTVYRLVGRKPVLLRELVEQSISGTDQAAVAEERADVMAVMAAEDARSKIVLYARATRRVQERLAPLFASLRDAAVIDSEAESVWREISERRAQNMRRFVEDIEAVGGLRGDLDVEVAADAVWATNGSELYLLLTDRRGWTPDRYEAWLADLWSRYLLAPD